MLKILLNYFFALALLLLSCIVDTARGQKKDTIFLENDASANSGAKVFIEKNRNSSVYKKLLDFTFDNDQTKEFNESNHELKKLYPNTFTKHPANIPKEWLPVCRYKRNYYLYSPAESGTEGKRIITDTTIIYEWMDGPIAQPIVSAKKINNNWTFKTKAFYQSPQNVEAIIIHVIDPKTMLSVWEEFSKLRGHNYQLYVPKKYAQNFDMVVDAGNPYFKIMPFPFDIIDYKRLLKQK